MKILKKNNINFKTNQSEKKEKLKQPFEKIDSLNSFKSFKPAKTSGKMISSNNIVNTRRSSLFYSNNLRNANLKTIRPINLPKKEKININDLNLKKLRPLSPIKTLIRYARDKIKKEYTSPYINKLVELNKKMFKDKKGEDKPMYYNLFKINEIFYKKRSSFNLNFLESNLFINDNEYLIKFFEKEEYRTIMRYLLGYIFLKDKNSQSFSLSYNHKKRIIYDEFFIYINNNYTLKEPNDENNFNLLKQKEIIDNFLLKKNLISLSMNAERDKVIFPFIKSANYFFIKDMPKKIVPNTLPNYFFYGTIFHILIKKYAFFKKFNIDVDIINKKNKKNIFDKTGNEMNSNDIAKSKTVSKICNLSDDSDSSQNSFLNNNLFNGLMKNDKTKHLNTHKNEFEEIKKIIKIIDEKNKERITPFFDKEKTYRLKNKISIRKKKIIKKPYKYYEIIQTDDFFIKKTEKAKILKYIGEEIINKTFLKLRTKRKHKTLLSIKAYRNIENLKTLNNEKFIRNNRIFLTNTNFINKGFSILNNNRYQEFESNKSNFYQKQYNNLKLDNTVNNKNKLFKVFSDLIKQKKISFSIKPKVNKLKFKDTSLFISRINNSLKEEYFSKKIIKGIIINYQKNNNEKKINSVNFRKINKFNVNNIPPIKKIKTRNKTKSINCRNGFYTQKKTKDKDTLNIEDIIKFRKIKI